jgi:signal transduction histidine kinase
MSKEILRHIVFLLVSLFVGTAGTLIIDGFENIKVEKRIREELTEEIRSAASAFKEIRKGSTADEVVIYLEKFSQFALSSRVRAVRPSRGEKPSAQDLSFLFSYMEKGSRIDFYLLRSSLKSHLVVLDRPALVFGLLAATIVFSLILVYSEQKKQAQIMNRRIEAQKAEMMKAIEEHEALALLGRMTATLAHELKTPIATISNLLQTLPCRIGDEKFVRRFVEMTQEEISRTRQLINNLLAYGKEIEVGRGVWVSVSMLLLKPAARYSLSIDVPPTLEVCGDMFYMELLFENLLRNSMMAGADTVQVAVHMRPDTRDGQAEISLHDNGEGFPPTPDLASLLRPFTTYRSNGAGLGLYLVNRIAAAHGGAISLHRPERGAEVHLLLPCKRVRLHGSA